ncbi:MAG TPA: carboxypeptidase-like regulatory domain-containing protein, partial [Flavisolibacter sp.]|nr:carboxypeptidase-like regulatory domain-containing protein [Flavisolibacter sp.]
MRKRYSAFSLLLLSVFFLQCQREVSHIGGPDFPGEIPTPAPITAAIQGNVFNENGAPAAGATVQVGSHIVLTNANGYFRINNASLDKKSAVVTASKGGYFKAYRTFGATSGANFVQIKLIKRTLAGTVDGAAGGEVSLSNGSKIALPAGGVVNAATNAAYTGT